MSVISLTVKKDNMKLEKELRRGNHINNGVVIDISGSYVTLSGHFNISGMTSIEFDKLKPTPIDDYWLKRFKFDYVKEVGAYANKSHIIYEEKEGDDFYWVFHPFCINDKDCWIKIKYVHELQNLCYDFTKEELE